MAFLPLAALSFTLVSQVPSGVEPSLQASAASSGPAFSLSATDLGPSDGMEGQGTVSLYVQDRVRQPGALAGDVATLQATFQIASDRYQIQLTQVGFTAPSPDNKGETFSPPQGIGGGVLLGHSLYGQSGLGPGRFPAAPAAIAVWGTGRVVKNGRLLTDRALIHASALSAGLHATDGTFRSLPKASEGSPEILVVAERLPLGSEPRGFVAFVYQSPLIETGGAQQVAANGSVYGSSSEQEGVGGSGLSPSGDYGAPGRGGAGGNPVASSTLNAYGPGTTASSGTGAAVGNNGSGLTTASGGAGSSLGVPGVTGMPSSTGYGVGSPVGATATVAGGAALAPGVNPLGLYPAATVATTGTGGSGLATGTLATTPTTATAPAQSINSPGGIQYQSIDFNAPPGATSAAVGAAAVSTLATGGSNPGTTSTGPFGSSSIVTNIPATPPVANNGQAAPLAPLPATPQPLNATPAAPLPQTPSPLNSQPATTSLPVSATPALPAQSAPAAGAVGGTTVR